MRDGYGYLWLDDDKKRTLEQKVLNALNFYRVKDPAFFPSVCYVHPSMLTDTTPKYVLEVSIRTKKNVLGNHLWFCRE